MEGGLSSTVSVSRKLNDHDYGAGEVFISISGITPETTMEEVAAILANDTSVYKLVKTAVLEKAQGLIG